MLANKTLKYGAGLIGLYLLVFYASGSGALISGTTAGAANVIRTLQGR
jgi:hypothetical protein